MTEHELTAEDYASVEHAGRTLHERGWRTVFSVNQMFDAWQQLIEQVEQGYDLGVDEYTNDLSCRDWLAQAWPLLTPRLRALRHPQLTALDTRFRAATVDDDGLALSSFHRVQAKGWWWRRRPRVLVGELAADLGKPAS